MKHLVTSGGGALTGERRFRMKIAVEVSATVDVFASSPEEALAKAIAKCRRNGTVDGWEVSWAREQ